MRVWVAQKGKVSSIFINLEFWLMIESSLFSYCQLLLPVCIAFLRLCRQNLE
jgi:hypothetical protein